MSHKKIYKCNMEEAVFSGPLQWKCLNEEEEEEKLFI
jgi:hypothetical protein